MEFFAITSLMILLLILLNLQKEDINTVLAQMTVYVVAIVRMMPSASKIMSALSTLSHNTKSVSTVYEDLQDNTYAEKKENIIEKVNFDNPFNNNLLVIKNINYSYPDSNRKIINDLSLNVKTGEAIGLIGESGSGKSTLVDLIIGLLKINNGSIMFNNMNIFSNINGWYSQIGYVPQEIYLVDDSIKKNIALGINDEDINLDKIYQVIDTLNLSTFIESLPDGINTNVGERGAKLSGGQLQRIGIARALYFNPKILFLDEASSFLDENNEKILIKELFRIKKDKIIFIISHKKSSVEICDRIYTIDNGSLISF